MYEIGNDIDCDVPCDSHAVLAVQIRSSNVDPLNS